MTQIFDPTGEVIPVTVLEAGPCHVLQVRTLERDGYEAVQLGFLNKSRRLASRSVRGHVAKLDSKRQRRLAAAGVQAPAKAGCEPKRWVREFRGKADDLTVGQQVNVEIFSKIASVDVIATSKGRGTAGVMKRHNYRGQRASHGVKKVHRHAGSTGRNTSPGRVEKGRRMAGRMGNERVTQRNLKVVQVDAQNNLLVVCGAVPGPNGGLVVIRQTNKLG
jgi:large subunit ribosomal protein L3